MKKFILPFILMTIPSLLLFSQHVVIPSTSTNPYTIAITPYDHNIVRVRATINDKEETKSLVVVGNPKNIVAKTTQYSDSTIIATNKIKVVISHRDGTVSFYSADNRLLLKEKTGGRKMVPAEVLGENTFHIQQKYEILYNEALYGLGQHQNGTFNYKDHDVDLWQYNIVAVVPFLVSSRNYGILWDNYSRTKFGDVREYESIENAPVYTSDGKQEGLTAEYYRDEAFNDLFLSRIEPRISYAFIDVHDNFPYGFADNVKSVRWKGSFECKKTGVYKFRLYSSGYTKMWLDDKLVVDSWRQNWLPWIHMPIIYMEEGKRYNIQIDWIHSGGYISLDYLPPSDTVEPNTVTLYSDVGDAIDYYFISGENVDSVISSYRWLTGQATLLPKWAYGLWQSRERYKTQDELLSVVKEFRRRSIPLDNIVQDWFYWPEDKWGDHDFDSTRFPNPQVMIQTLQDSLNTRIMISVWPKFYVGTQNYEEMMKRGFLYMRNIEKGQKDWVGPGYVSTFYDPYSEEARELYWEQINKKLFSLGIDAWWLDCTEPDIQSNLSRYETILRQGPTALGSAARYLNTYSLMNSKAVYEGQRKTKPDQRVYILTRSAFAGQQRYAATTWSGDVAARWYDLQMQILAGLNFCLSGIPYWTTDIGGFAVEPRFENPDSADLEEWRELMTRWFQFGSFCPIFRVHGQYPYREMFFVAPDTHPAYQSMVKYTKLRYRLLPYIYSLAGMVTHRGYTIMRALAMDFNSDSSVLNIGDQFMFGSSILVCPVTSYQQRLRNVYLPKGQGWFNVWNGKYYVGGITITTEAPYTDIPLFIREGSIIPFGPELQYATQKQADTIHLCVFTGGDAYFELYEDDGLTYDYEKGYYNWIALQYSEQGKKLSIGNRKGNFKNHLPRIVFKISWIDKRSNFTIDAIKKADRIIEYVGKEIVIQRK